MLNFFLSASQILTEEGNWHKNYKNVSFSTNLSNIENFNSWMIQLNHSILDHHSRIEWFNWPTPNFSTPRKKSGFAEPEIFLSSDFCVSFSRHLKLEAAAYSICLLKHILTGFKNLFFYHFQYFLSRVEFFWTWSKVRLYLTALPSYLSIFEHNQKYWSLSKTFEHCQNIFELTNGIGMRETTKIKISSL